MTDDTVSVQTPNTDKPNTKRVRFDVDTSKSEVTQSDDGETRLKVPVSSLQQDRDNDEIADDGMDSLLSQVNEQPIGLFPNHGMDPESAMYDFREMFGAWESGSLEEDQTYGEVRLLRKSPDSEELVEDAQTLVNLVEQDMPVGFSIGFGWDEKDVEERDDGGLIFHDMDLMEISAVGIPSNPEAVVGASVAKALSESGIDGSAVDTDTLTQSLKESMIANNTSETKGSSLSNLLEPLVSEAAEDEDVDEADIMGRIAEAAGMDESTIANIVNGDIQCPDQDRFRAFAEVLDVTVEELVEAAEQDGCDYTETESNTMVETENNHEGQNFKQLDDETAEKLASRINSVVQGHFEAMQSEIVETITEGMDEDEDEDGEETEANDEEEDEEEEDEKVAELEAELEALKDELAESQGRKTGMESGVETDEQETEDKEADREPAEFADNLV
jgi:hypothetical protein